jgi:hypothetical protein
MAPAIDEALLQRVINRGEFFVQVDAEVPLTTVMMASEIPAAISPSHNPEDN